MRGMAPRAVSLAGAEVSTDDSHDPGLLVTVPGSPRFRTRDDSGGFVTKVTGRRGWVLFMATTTKKDPR